MGEAQCPQAVSDVAGTVCNGTVGAKKRRRFDSMSSGNSSRALASVGHAGREGRSWPPSVKPRSQTGGHASAPLLPRSIANTFMNAGTEAASPVAYVTQVLKTWPCV